MGQIIRRRWPEGRLRAFTMSYDDGRKEDFRLAEIMRKNGVKGTFNVNTGCFRPEDKPLPEDPDHRRMTRREFLQFVEEYGDIAEIAVHTVTHPNLSTLTRDRAVWEVIQDRAAIEELTGKLCRGMAYPYALPNDTAASVPPFCGMAYSRGGRSTKDFGIPGDWMRLPPTCHHTDPALFQLKDAFFAKEETSKTDALLFYMWGHAYEFDDDDNWDLIENFLAEMGNRDDVWYATNIEICDYVAAFRSLLWSARGDRVYNPNCDRIWFADKQNTYMVEPGQELRI